MRNVSSWQTIVYLLLLSAAFIFSGYKNYPGYHSRIEEVWLTDHFEPSPGKIIGIWPHHERFSSPQKINRLRYKFGFNYALLPSSLYIETFRLLTENGFPKERIAAQFLPNNLQYKLNYYGKIYAYYLDEPNERGYSPEGIKEKIKKSADGSLFIISGYRRTTGLNEFVTISDGVMFSSYKHWWQCFPGVWCAWPENDDQRDDWTDMKERYGKKSFTNWVGAHRDTLEYDELLKHAASIGLSGVWLYQYQEPLNSDENILSFCNAAWKAGYLLKYERKYLYEYRCYKNSQDDCKQNDWQLHSKSSTVNVRPVFP